MEVVKVVKDAACCVEKSAQMIEHEAHVETQKTIDIGNKLTQGQIEVLQKFGRRPYMNK